MKTPEIGLNSLSEELHRSRLVIEKHQGTCTFIDKQPLISFSHNDYLGLSHHPKVIQAAQQAIQDYGTSANASPLVAGHTRLHQSLEMQLAERLDMPKALLFSSGTVANYALIRCLGQNNQPFFADKLCHASLIDGMAQQKNKVRRFPNNKMHFPEKWIHNHNKSEQKSKPIVVTEGVFSMEGNQSDLIALTALKKQHDYSLVVDDSHGIGVLGDAGAGTTAHFGIKADIITASLGKALASHGGFVAGPEDLIEALIQSARPLIYSTAIPPSSAAAALAALTLMEKKSQHQAKCHENIAYFREQSKEKGLNALKSQTAIQGIIISDIKQLKTVHQHLLESGFLVGMIRPPSVPKNSSRLRICLSAAHTKKHIDALIQHTLIALEKST